jgi:hypothetical protein
MVTTSPGGLRPNERPAYAPYIPDSAGLFGMIDLDMDVTSIPYGSSSRPESSLTIGGVKIEGGSLTKNKIKAGLQQGLRKVLIDNWLDPQIKYIANNFTKMHLSIKWPDVNALVAEAKTLADISKTVGTESKNGIVDAAVHARDALKNIKNINSQSLLNTISQYDQLSQKVTTINDQIANPFEQLSLLFNQSNIINIDTKNLTVKIPMIFQEDINAYEIYLRQRADTNASILEDWKVLIESITSLCANIDIDKEVQYLLNPDVPK